METGRMGIRQIGGTGKTSGTEVGEDLTEKDGMVGRGGIIPKVEKAAEKGGTRTG
jgi:hypothetical protein